MSYLQYNISKRIRSVTELLSSLYFNCLSSSHDEYTMYVLFLIVTIIYNGHYIKINVYTSSQQYALYPHYPLKLLLKCCKYKYGYGKTHRQ